MSKLLIKSGRVIDPSIQRDEVSDLYVENGKIVEYFQNESGETHEIDARGMWVVPGLIDLHVHFRDPGQTHKEDIESGLRSAVAGGFTTVCTMPNTSPTTDSPELIKYQIDKAEKLGLAKLLPTSAITKGLNGTELVDPDKNIKAGAAAFTDDGKSVMNLELVEKFFADAGKLGVPVFVHCEDLNLVKAGQVCYKAAKRLKLAPICNESESTIVKRDIDLAIKHGTKLHICHVSTKQSAVAIANARKTHPHLITAEVSPHHLMLTEKDIKRPDANFKMCPPLRTKKDQKAMIKAVQDGVITVIATDHAPHSVEEKSQAFEKAPNGIVGLETAVGVVLTKLYHSSKRRPCPVKIIAALTSNPAKILGVDAGTLQVGKPADITIIDPERFFTVDAKTFKSKSQNTPFHGRGLQGKVIYTIVSGEVRFQVTG